MIAQGGFDIGTIYIAFIFTSNLTYPNKVTYLKTGQNLDLNESSV